MVCPNEACSALYKITDGKRTCTHTSFQKVCGYNLGHFTNLAHGKKRWKPFKTYQFMPPSSWLKKMFSFKSFHTLLEQDREPYPSDVLSDVQDGRVWKELESTNFFSTKYNVGLMLNVDWFQPFKRSQYKVAAIMLTVLNLPRVERFKKKWTIIAGNTSYVLLLSYYDSVVD